MHEANLSHSLKCSLAPDAQLQIVLQVCGRDIMFDVLSEWHSQPEFTWRAYMVRVIVTRHAITGCSETRRFVG